MCCHMDCLFSTITSTDLGVGVVMAPMVQMVATAGLLR